MPKSNASQRKAGKRDLPNAVKHFDQLPDSARINSRALKILLGISTTTFWRRRKTKLIDEPDKFGTWSVAYARELLNSGAREAA